MKEIKIKANNQNQVVEHLPSKHNTEFKPQSHQKQKYIKKKEKLVSTK
jgi:hypothetical protein